MMSLRSSTVLAIALVATVGPTAQPGPDAALARGIALVEAADFAQAVPVLELAVDHLKATRGPALARAYRYLGIAHVGLGYEMQAKARTLEAIADDGKGERHVERSPLAHARVSDIPASEPPGLLQVAVQPWAEVTVDGVSVGLTPFSRVRVRPGSHTVRLEHPAFEPLERPVSVRPGELTRLVVDMVTEGVRKEPEQ